MVIYTPEKLIEMGYFHLMNSQHPRIIVKACEELGYEVQIYHKAQNLTGKIKGEEEMEAIFVKK